MQLSRRQTGFLAALALIGLAARGNFGLSGLSAAAQAQTKPFPLVKSEAEWRKKLTPEQFRILREAGTEPAFSGQLWNNHATGLYTCAACGLPLFSSKTKFESGTGWPSFWDAVAKGNVRLMEDDTLGMQRTEVLCGRCGGHLGHVFDDGPKPTGQRYCINSASLAFVKNAAPASKAPVRKPKAKP